MGVTPGMRVLGDWRGRIDKEGFRGVPQVRRSQVLYIPVRIIRSYMLLTIKVSLLSENTWHGAT